MMSGMALSRLRIWPMDYTNIGIRCRCGGAVFRGDFVRQPGLDDVMTCINCSRSDTVESWRIRSNRADRRAAAAALRLASARPAQVR